MAARPLRAARAQAPMRLRLVPPAQSAPSLAPGELEPELLAFIRALAEADAEDDFRAANQRRSLREERK